MKALTLLVAALLISTGSQAQETIKKERDYKLVPYLFIGVQGGTTRTFTNPDLKRKWAPMGAVSVGGYLTPWLGVRLQGNGWQWDEDLLKGNGTYRTTQYGGNADLLLNITGMLMPNRNNLINVVALGGWGMHYLKFDVDETSHRYPLSLEGNRWTRGYRVGGQLDVNMTKHFSLQFEGGYHQMYDHFNGFKEEKLWPYLMAGLSYKFGHPRVKTPQAQAALPQTNTFSIAEEMGNYQMMTTKLNSEMELWEKRMPNESLEEYQIRVNPTTRAAQTQKMEYEIATQMATNQLADSDVKLGKYNPTLKKLAVQVGSVPDIYLDMEESEVADLYNNKNLKLKNAKYRVKKDNSYELVYAEVENTMTGKTYVFDNLKNESLDKIRQDANFVSVETIKPKSQQKTVQVENTDKKPVTVNYEVEEQASTQEDLASGHYHANESKAIMQMLKSMKKDIGTNYAQYIAGGKRVRIVIKGSADATSIRCPITYEGEYGEFKNQPVEKNGEKTTISLTREGGIEENEQLAFARAVSAADYIRKEIPELDNSKVNIDYVIDVAKETGGKYRRVSVECIFVDSF